ncbi:MAG TPA: hypothetical protein PKD26_11500 [Pyrinomonadaceae bacterium]|nr:hypothetical protein [Pyrinomonadaceae bacterium]
MENVPAFVSVVFMVTTFVAVCIFLFAVRSVREGPWSRLLLFLIPFWLLFLFVAASSGFFINTDALPPRLFFFGIFPPLSLIAILFLFARQTLISQLSLTLLTLVHVVRIPVEFVLAWLAEAGAIPALMTYHGTNFDILSGLTAPIALAAVVSKSEKMRFPLIGWNLAALALLFNIVITAALCLPSPIQRLALDQPNLAVLYFPYVWLPGVIVPIVFFSHLAVLYNLLCRQK